MQKLSDSCAVMSAHLHTRLLRCCKGMQCWLVEKDLWYRGNINDFGCGEGRRWCEREWLLLKCMIWGLL